MGRVDATELARVKEEITRRGNGNCPDQAYCANYNEECKHKKSCFPFAKNDVRSVLYVWALHRIMNGERVDYDDRLFIFNKQLFVDGGGDPKDIDFILDDAVESSNKRKEL